MIARRSMHQLDQENKFQSKKSIQREKAYRFNDLIIVLISGGRIDGTSLQNDIAYGHERPQIAVGASQASSKMTSSGNSKWDSHLASSTLRGNVGQPYCIKYPNNYNVSFGDFEKKCACRKT
jgi:hypothetical protein